MSIHRSVLFVCLLILVGSSSLFAQPLPSKFVPLAPCRLFDSRVVPGSMLLNGTITYIAARGDCNIPETANAVFVTVATTGALSAGHLTIYGSDILLPSASTMNYRGFGTDSASTFVRLCYPVEECSGVDTAIHVSTTPTHVILDVVGYTEIE
jgi:hypothetical protein